MKNNFQIIIIIVFIAAAVIALLIFSGSIPLGGNSATTGAGTVTVWGTIRGDVVNPLLDEFNTANPAFVVKYVQKDKDTFDQDLLEALASGAGPDMFFISQDLAYHYGNKILVVPYTTYPMSAFQTNFASAGEVFTSPAGIIAFPVLIDPLVMYYNRTTLDTNGIVYPPATWDELVSMVPALTKKDDTNKINKSAVAFGHFSNVAHAKDILSMLFMQTGNKIVKEQGGRFISDLNNSSSTYQTEDMLKFYTDFANPQESIYSWNKSFPNARDYFSTENLAFYFGYASELTYLVNKNPNHNMLVASVPQIKGSNSKATMAQVTGLAISRFSTNSNTALIAAQQMSSGSFAAQLAQNLGVAPARRDLLAVKPTDSYFSVFYKSALYAQSWLDPSPKDTDDIFSKMIDGVLSNIFRADQAISDASSKISLLLNK